MALTLKLLNFSVGQSSCLYRKIFGRVYWNSIYYIYAELIGWAIGPCSLGTSCIYTHVRIYESLLLQLGRRLRPDLPAFNSIELVPAWLARLFLMKEWSLRMLLLLLDFVLLAGFLQVYEQQDNAELRGRMNKKRPCLVSAPSTCFGASRSTYKGMDLSRVFWNISLLAFD